MSRNIYCEYCGYFFDEAAGRYGCPNCLGEGFMYAESTVRIAPHIRTTTLDEHIHLALKVCDALAWIARSRKARARRSFLLRILEQE